MIIGSVNGSRSSIRYDQENNIIEQVFRDLKNRGDLSFWLESCGVESTSCGIEAVGGQWKYPLPIIDGLNFMGQGDLMFFFLNSEAAKKFLPKVSDTVLENEFIENLNFAVPLLSTAESKIHSFDNSEVELLMISLLQKKSSIVLSYITDYNSGHYICVVSYDTSSKEFICYDSWGKNKHCVRGGIQEKYPADFFHKKSRGKLMEIYLP